MNARSERRNVCVKWGWVNDSIDTSISPFILMFLIAVVAAWSVTSGLKKGVKWLSNISTVMVSLLMISIVFIGVFYHDIFNFLGYIANGTGLLFANYLRYNDFMNEASDSWAAANPIFFNLWFAAWAAPTTKAASPQAIIIHENHGCRLSSDNSIFKALRFAFTE